MRSLLAVIGILVLIAALTPSASAAEWHTGTWTDSGHAAAHPATELATGGYFESSSGQANGWVCYNIGNTTMALKRVTGTFSVNRTSGDDAFYLITSNSCGAGTSYPNATSGSPLTDQAFDYSPNLSSGYQYIGFQWGGQTDHRKLSDIKLYWNEFPNVSADFKATPTQGASPIYIYFEDNSTGAPNSFNWSISPATGWWTSPSELTQKNVTVYFTVDGNYSITHGASNGYASDIETKTDYIWIYGNNASSTTGFQTIDGLSGNPIRNSSIQMYDIENSSWKNETAPYGDASITTLNGHTINAYAQAFGFGDADLLGQPARHNQVYPIMMWPTGMGGNVSVGNVTLYVTVQDKDTRAPISGASVTASTTAESTGTTTNAAGIATFVIKNNTLVYVTAQATGQGYKTAVQSINTGTASGGSASAVLTILLAKNTVTPTPAVTTLPGGGTPTPTTTVDPYPCDADHPENCQRKQTELGNMLVGYGPMLVSFFIMLTIVGGVKLMGKR